MKPYFLAVRCPVHEEPYLEAARFYGMVRLTCPVEGCGDLTSTDDEMWERFKAQRRYDASVSYLKAAQIVFKAVTA